MKIAAISDTHGVYLGNAMDSVKDIDILLIAGDTADLYTQKSIDGSREFYEKNFIPWTQKLDTKHIVMVAGNHDFFLEACPKEFRKMIEGTNITYLENEYCEIDGITIYGTPLCHKFYNWAFMPDDDTQIDIYKKTMDDRNIDILLAHDAPYGCSDICWDSSWGREHIGSEILRDIVHIKNPTYLIHGHLHSSNHEEEILGDTKVYNVSLVGEDYMQKYKPLIFEI